MASSAINLMVLLFALVFGTSTGFRIDNTQSNTGFQNYPSNSFSIANSNFPVQPFTRKYQNVNDGPIAGYPKVPPPNAFESGGIDGDLLPPEAQPVSGTERRNQFFRRSTDFANVDPHPFGRPLLVQGASWEGGNQEVLGVTAAEKPLPLKILQDEKAADPKTGQLLLAQSNWKNDGGNGDTLKLPLEGAVEKTDEQKVDPKTGYPYQAESHWNDAGGDGDILEPPLEDPLPTKSAEDEKAVDPKTGYPLEAEPHWKDAGGNEDILELPLEDPLPSPSSEKNQNDKAVDPKTGYPLEAEPHWKDAGGNEEILELPLKDSLTTRNSEEEKAVDPKTGYPLEAEPHWKDAGGNEEILELPLEDPLPSPSSDDSQNEKAIDPKTGYPLQAEPHWKDAGGNEKILELPLEDSPPSKNSENEEPVDPKTGYPLQAQSHWSDAGGNEGILELPLENSQSSKTPQNEEKVDPKTGYPLQAQPHWRDAGGNEDILELPLEDPVEQPDSKKTDAKTGYPFMAEPSWKDAGGNGDILDLPLEEMTAEKRVDKKTGYPFVAEPGWKDAGGNEEILELPLENTMNGFAQQRETESQQGLNLNANSFRKSPIQGSSEALERSLSTDEKDVKVDPKTGYPLVAQLQWAFAGGDGNVLKLPAEDFPNQFQGRSAEAKDEDLLTELRPPAQESNYYSGFGTFPFDPIPSVSSKTHSFRGIQFFDNNRIPRQRPTTGDTKNIRQQTVYTLTYPDNAVVTVSHFTSGDNQNRQSLPTGYSTSFKQKQLTQNFPGGKSQTNSNGNSLKSFPTARTTASQQFKTFQPNRVTNFQLQQHQFKESPSFLTSNIATSFT